MAVAHRIYARALFDAARGQDRVDVARDQLAELPGRDPASGQAVPDLARPPEEGPCGFRILRVGRQHHQPDQLGGLQTTGRLEQRRQVGLAGAELRGLTGQVHLNQQFGRRPLGRGHRERDDLHRRHHLSRLDHGERR